MPGFQLQKQTRRSSHSPTQLTKIQLKLEPSSRNLLMNQPPAFSRQWQELIEKASVAESRRRLGEGLADEMYDNPTVVRVSVAVVLRLRHLCPTACPLHAAPSPCQNASRRLSRVCAFRGMLNIWSNAILRSSKQVLRQHPWIFERKQEA